MAGITIPLITEFKDVGIKQAIKEFKNLETASEKAQFAIKKAALPAAAALGAVVAVIGASVKAAIEDEAAQANLARQIKSSTDATKKQIKGVEQYISSLGRSVAVSDDEARPAFQALVVATKDLTKAQNLMNLAIDVSAATGQDLTSVTDALAKAYAGNMRGLQSLSPELKAMIKDGADLETVMGVLKTNFGGAGKAAADTAAGGMKKLDIAFNETKESIGNALLPVLEKILPILEKFAAWAENNTGVFLAVAGAIAAISAAIILANVGIKLYETYTKAAAAATWLLNWAMNANPITLIIIALVAAAAAMIFLYNKVEFFREVVQSVVGKVVAYFEMVVNVFITVINALIRGYNLIPFLDNIEQLSKVNFDGVTGSAKNLGEVMGVSAERAKELQAQYAELKTVAVAPLTEELKKTATAVATVESEWKVLTGTLSRTVALDDAREQVKELAAAAAIAFATGKNSDIVKYNKAASDMASMVATLADGFDKISSKEILLRFKTSGSQAAINLAAWLAGGGELKGLSTYDLLTQAGIPGLASGGKVAGGGMPYIVGEKGPELFTPQSSGTITPNGAFASAGATNYITINTGADPQAVVRALQTYNRTTGAVPLNTRAF